MILIMLCTPAYITPNPFITNINIIPFVCSQAMEASKIKYLYDSSYYYKVYLFVLIMSIIYNLHNTPIYFLL